jgi:uncharacterized membrane protein YidH (DUF202 family)
VRGRPVDAVVAAGFALAGFAVLLAPAISMRWGGLDAGVGSLDEDILGASLVMGAVHLVAVATRRRYERRTAPRRAHVWIASLNALVMLGLSASLLLLAVLYWFPDEHASLANRGFPVVLLWVGIQLVAVVLAEVTARFLLRWLRAGRADATT